MREIHYMSLKEGSIFAFCSLLIVAMYLAPLLDYAWYSRYFWRIAIGSFFSCLLMFLWKVDVAENGHVLCFGFDTKQRTGPGMYLMPALFPFLREIAVIIGYAVQVPSRQHEGNTSNLRILFDQRRPLHHVNVQTNMAGSMISQITTSLIFFICDLRSADGKVKYYKLGTYGYLIAWAVAGATH